MYVVFRAPPDSSASCAAISFLLAAPSAGAHVLHTVAPGETLWWIAAQSNLTTRSVAVYNGLRAGREDRAREHAKEIPSAAEGAAALAAAGVTTKPAPSSTPVAVPATTGDRSGRCHPQVVTTVPAGAPRVLGAYVVRAGDTLGALAAQTGVSAAQMAFVNGIDLDVDPADRDGPEDSPTAPRHRCAPHSPPPPSASSRTRRRSRHPAS